MNEYQYNSNNPRQNNDEYYQNPYMMPKSDFSEDLKPKRDWGLILSGIVMVLLAAFFLFAPGITLVTLTVLAGVGLIVSGVGDIASYFRFKKIVPMSGWLVAYGIINFLAGFFFILYPVLLSGVIPAILGAAFVFFGILEIAAAISLRRTEMPLWGWMLCAGVIEILCGIMFVAMPSSIVIFLAVFLLVRGISMTLYGARASTVLR